MGHMHPIHPHHIETKQLLFDMKKELEQEPEGIWFAIVQEKLQPLLWRHRQSSSDVDVSQGKSWRF